jgi:hypothetical protein
MAGLENKNLCLYRVSKFNHPPPLPPKHNFTDLSRFIYRVIPKEVYTFNNLFYKYY